MSMSNQVYTVQKIFLSQKYYNSQICSIVWQQFVKWSYSRFDLDRHVTFINIGDFGYKTHDRTQTKIPYLFFNQSFLKKHDLHLKIQSFQLRPVVKISYLSIKNNSNLQKLKVDDVQFLLKYLLQFIEKIIKDKQKNFILINLDIMGNIIKRNQQIWFQHAIPKPTQRLKSMKLRDQVDKLQMKIGNLNINKLSLLTTKEKFLPKIQIKTERAQKNQRQKLLTQQNKLKKIQSTSHIQTGNNCISNRKSKQKIYKKFQQNDKKQQKVLRSNSLKQFRSTRLNSFNKSKKYQPSKQQNQMMIAGIDPLKKNENFSHLTSNLNDLMKTKFSWNKISLNDNIPLINQFSQTLACPYAVERQSNVIGARIGAFYCPNVNKLSIRFNDIFFLTIQQKNCILDIGNSSNKTLLDIGNQYNICKKLQPTLQQKQYLLELRNNYLRYSNLFKKINLKHISPFVIRQIFKELKQKFINFIYIIEQVEKQIQQSYIYSIKKSIIDYVLMDEVERYRLAVFINFKKVDLLNNAINTQSLGFNQLQFNRIRQVIDASLMKNSQNVLEIVNQWQKLLKSTFIYSLPQDYLQLFTVDQFCDKQKRQIKNIKDHLLNKWIPKVAQIYKNQIFQLKKDKNKCSCFFNSTSILLYNQIREKIMQMIQNYNIFLRKYVSQQINPPDTAFHLQKTMGIYEKSFIKIRISYRKEQIYFMDSPDQVYKKLLQLITHYKQLLANIPRPQSLFTPCQFPYLFGINQDQPDFNYHKQSISNLLHKTISNAKKSLQIYNKYDYLLVESNKIDYWVGEVHDRREYALEITKYKVLYDEVMEHVPFNIRLNMFNIDSNQIKRLYLNIIDQIKDKIQASIFQLVIKKNYHIQQSITQMMEIACSKATTCQKLVEIESYVDNFKRNQIKKLQLKSVDLMKWITITLYNTTYRVSSKDLLKISETSKLLSQIYRLLQSYSFSIQSQRSNLQKQLSQQKANLSKNLISLLKQIQKLKQFSSLITKSSVLQLLLKIRQQINLFIEIKINLNRRQKMLGFQETEFQKLIQWDHNLRPFQQLWRIADTFTTLNHKCTRDTVFQLHSQQIHIQCINMTKSLTALLNNQVLKQYAPLSIKVAQTLLRDIKNLQRNIGIIQVFSNRGLKARHFKQIQVLIKFQGQLSSQISLSLNKLLSLRVFDYITQLQQISFIATRQYNIQQTILRIKNEFKILELVFIFNNNHNISQLVQSSIEEIQNLLNQFQTQILAVKGSVYARIFQDQLEQLNIEITQIIYLLTLSAKFQHLWMYIQPIMKSSDINKTLSSQATKFVMVDANWRKIVLFYEQNRKLQLIAQDKSLMKVLKQSLSNLDIILKGLHLYLQQKRIMFPRLFFLSNSQIMSLLSYSKNPQNIQPYLKKLFPNIQKLKIQQNRYIIGIYSKDEQYLSFQFRINMGKGNVQEWLKEIQEKMRKTIAGQINKALTQYQFIQNYQNIFNTPSMVLQVVQMIQWTKLVESLFLVNQLSSCFQKINQKIQSFMVMRRQLISQRKDILLLESLTILLINNLSILSYLIKKNIASQSCFQWTSQPRYYHYHIQYSQTLFSTKIKILQSIHPYNNQYLGSYTRLLLTPLTSRCYVSLCRVTESNRFCMVKGEGKMEIVRDFANLLANFFLSFTCNQQLDHRDISRIFKGILATGAWACFQYFTKIKPQMLSVVAQQLLAIHNAKNKDLTTVTIQNVDISIKKTANIFVTLKLNENTVLMPSNLKYFFRNVQVTNPDYQFITQNLLFTFGFNEYKSLTNKIIVFRKLYIEKIQNIQFGMKFINKIVFKLRQLKKIHRQENQSSLLLNSLESIFLSSLKKGDTIKFKAILSQIFEQINKINIQPSLLIKSIREQLQIQNLSLNDYQLQKIIQTYDTLRNKQNIIVTGDPFAGKTTCINMLSKVINKSLQPISSSNIQILAINPKTLTIDELFGHFDQVTKQWQQGLLQTKLKQITDLTTKIRKWIVFDGPIHSYWIERLNMLLGQNPKITFNNGETIFLHESIHIFFEELNIERVTPGLVNRCGLVHFQIQLNAHKLLLSSWKNSYSWLDKRFLSAFDQFFSQIANIYNQNISKCTSIMSLTTSMLQIISYFMDQLKQFTLKSQLEDVINIHTNSLPLSTDDSTTKHIKFQQKQVYSISGSIFFYSILWSFGAILDISSRRAFDIYLKRLVIAEFSKNKNTKINLPDKGSLFQYKISFQNINTRPQIRWIKLADDMNVQVPMNYPIHQVYIKTVNIKSNQNILQIYLRRNLPVILIGPSGSGRSSFMINFKRSSIKYSQSIFSHLVLSYSSECRQIQNKIQQNFDKRSSKQVIRPIDSNKLILFVQDINLVRKQEYGASPLELLRELITINSMIDISVKKKPALKIIKTNYILSSSPSTKPICPRLASHLSSVSFHPSNQQQKTQIFTCILNHSFKSHPQQKNMKLLLKYCLQLFQLCGKQFERKKLFYGFGFQQLRRMVLGICTADKQKLHSQNLGRLFAHEARRVITDQLIQQNKIQAEQFILSIGKKWGKNMDVTYFSDIISSSNKSYEQINDLQKVRLSVNTFLKNYNIGSQKPLDIILFNQSLQHILTIHRILCQPSGHALLIGNSGTGRKSCASLAANLLQAQIFTLQCTKEYTFIEFKQEVRKLFIRVGTNDKKTVWKLTDQQLKDDKCMDIVNSILNVGFVTNILTSEDKILIPQKLRKQITLKINSQPTINQILNYFYSKIRTQLKLILCFNPIGQALTLKIKKFPSLIKHTHVDFYEDWPSQAMIYIAEKSLGKVEIKHKQIYFKMMTYLHSNSKQWVQVYRQQMNRDFYINSCNFIEFLNLFKLLLTNKRKQVTDKIYNYEKCFEKLVQIQLGIQNLGKNKSLLRQKLKKSQQNLESTLQILSRQRQQSSKLQESVNMQQNLLAQESNHYNQLFIQCDQQLNLVLPQLKQAQQGLLVLDKNSLTELKTMNNPPQTVKLVLQALCLLIDPYPKEKIKNQKNFKMEIDWWAASVRNLNNPKLLELLINFNKETFNQKLIENTQNFINQPNNQQLLTPFNVAKSSLACQCIIHWIYGILNFYNVHKKIKPKKQQLKLSDNKLIELKKSLKIRKQQLFQSSKKVKQKSDQYEKAKDILTKITNEQRNYESQIQKANLIISNLTYQKRRWSNLIQQYKIKQTTIESNVLLSSAIITYTGPFTEQYRQKIINQWKNKLQTFHLKINQDYSTVKFLQSTIKQQSYRLNELPEDDFFSLNSLIISNSKRWPIIIDPQQQANIWLKKQYQQRKIKVIRPTQQNYMRNLQNCIQFGYPVLVQNITQFINSQLSPVFTKKTYKKGPTTYLKMGKTSLIYSNDFTMFLTTKLSNPHYQPQIFTYASLINFTMTDIAFSQKVLSFIVGQELPDIQKQKLQLKITMLNDTRLQIDNQQNILNLIKQTKNALQDQYIVDKITILNKNLIQIADKRQSSIELAYIIQQTRQKYRNLAQNLTLFFMKMLNLQKQSSMNRFSLKLFLQLVNKSINTTIRPNNLQQRLSNIIQMFEQNYQKIIRRALFKPYIQSSKRAISIQEMNQISSQATFSTPILFICRNASTPYDLLKKLSQQKQIPLQTISLGPNQFIITQRLIRQQIVKGGWVLIQNCQFGFLWINSLNKILQELGQMEVNANFRIFLTISQGNYLPQELLDKCIKIALQYQQPNIQAYPE